MSTIVPPPSQPEETRPTLETLLENPLARDGFVFVRANAMHSLLPNLAQWDRFAASWDDLGVDLYMADGGRYRRRRYATFSLSGEMISRKPHQPHYQSRDYNTLNGGIERWFEPFLPETAANPALEAILRLVCRVATDLTPPERRPASWHAETHQFRIEAQPDMPGHPTPEGLHRDGVDWVCVIMIRRENVACGETSIHDLNRRLVGSFTLTEPLDTAFVNDNRVYHGVTPVEQDDPTRPGWRDVLVVTLRHE
ncbi:MAG: 2OG-Fe dioxygenase family protein [Acetobacter peroxydans]|nr:2OG-Fe dioxygenase family protein [Acetobacter peroxydans]MCI2078162.1 2OG-Fe dioxygenase family protein [Acetobacter peroxydans]